MSELIYPELSYKIVGILFRVFKQLGHGHQEKIYQKAIKATLMKDSLPFTEQTKLDVSLYGKCIGKYYVDFIIDNKILLEIKPRSSFYRSDYLQVVAYLKQSNLELGLLAGFGKEGVKVKRLLKGNYVY